MTTTTTGKRSPGKQTIWFPGHRFLGFHWNNNRSGGRAREQCRSLSPPSGPCSLRSNK